MTTKPRTSFINKSLLLHCVTALLIISMHVSTAFAIRPAQISSFISPSSVQARSYFQGARGHYRFGGGVVPRGHVTFRSEEGVTIPIGDLTLVSNPAPTGDNTTIPVGLKWKNAVYALPMERDVICPLARFIQRNNFIAYTIPEVKSDLAYFKSNGLVEAGEGAFVAKEFSALEDFLAAVDLFTLTEPIPDQDLAAKIKTNANGSKRDGTIDAIAGEGTYVNADFHVDYQAFLMKIGDRTVVDIAGLPLRYTWEIGTDGKAVVQDVEIFAYPAEEDSLQHSAVLFFQNAAVLRQFKESKATDFARFLTAACTDKSD